MTDFLVRGSLAKLDPDVYELTQLEAERQARKLILIPSESTAPLAVREAMGSAFQNIYAEGYPDEDSRLMSEAEILDYPERLAHFRRNGDPRYYKGIEYADVVEALARRRAAEAFAANGVNARSALRQCAGAFGAPANNAVYHALVEPGSVVMGMNLLHGGTSRTAPPSTAPASTTRSSTTASTPTRRLDYDEIRKLALENKPKMIIAGYSSYSWMPDWKKFREIADEVGAYFLADISHIGGLVAAGVIPSPIGFAHVIMSTTHKSLDGPRGAVLLTTHPAIAKKLDKAVFPGEQGGPHVHIFAALALTFKLARTPQFKKLQAQTIKNAQAMVDQFKKRGLRVPFGGTNCHMLNVDCHQHQGSGWHCPQRRSGRAHPRSGRHRRQSQHHPRRQERHRSQRHPPRHALDHPARLRCEARAAQLADIIADVLLACAPHAVDTPHKGRQRRAKVDFNVLNNARLQGPRPGRPRPASTSSPRSTAIPTSTTSMTRSPAACSRSAAAARASSSNYALSSDLSALKPGKSQPTQLATPKGTLSGVAHPRRRQLLPAFRARPPPRALAATWLRDLSDGYTSFDLDGGADYSTAPHARVRSSSAASTKKPAVAQRRSRSARTSPGSSACAPRPAKPTPLPCIQMDRAGRGRAQVHAAARDAQGHGRQDGAVRRLGHAGLVHLRRGGASRHAPGRRPVRRQPHGRLRCARRRRRLLPRCGLRQRLRRPAARANRLYTHFLTPDADVVDDTLVYRRGWDNYLVVVNASNDDKDRTWLESVRDGKVRIDNARPWARTFGYEARIRNLRDPKSGDDMRVDIALQGPKSRDILLAMGVDDAGPGRAS